MKDDLRGGKMRDKISEGDYRTGKDNVRTKFVEYRRKILSNNNNYLTRVWLKKFKAHNNI